MSDHGTAYWWTCDNCQTNYTISPHWGRGQDLPESSEWDSITLECYVCGEWCNTWEGTDPAQNVLKNTVPIRKSDDA